MAYQLPDSPVRIYLGSQAILARLGYRSPKILHQLMTLEGLPCYKRRIGIRHAWCISESSVTAWEIAKGQRWVAALRARQESKKMKGKYALAG